MGRPGGQEGRDHTAEGGGGGVYALLEHSWP